MWISAAGRKLVSLPVKILRPIGRLPAAAAGPAVLFLALGALLLAGCGSSHHHREGGSSSTPTSTLTLGPAPAPNAGQSGRRPRGAVNVYSADAAGT